MPGSLSTAPRSRYHLHDLKRSDVGAFLFFSETVEQLDSRHRESALRTHSWRADRMTCPLTQVEMAAMHRKNEGRLVADSVSTTSSQGAVFRCVGSVGQSQLTAALG